MNWAFQTPAKISRLFITAFGKLNRIGSWIFFGCARILRDFSCWTRDFEPLFILGRSNYSWGVIVQSHLHFAAESRFKTPQTRLKEGPQASLKSPLNGLAKVRQYQSISAKPAHKKRLNFELWKTNEQEEEEAKSHKAITQVSRGLRLHLVAFSRVLNPSQGFDPTFHLRAKHTHTVKFRKI